VASVATDELVVVEIALKWSDQRHEIVEEFHGVGDLTSATRVGQVDWEGNARIVPPDRFGGSGSPYLKIFPKASVRVTFPGDGAPQVRFWWGGGDAGNRVRIDLATARGQTETVELQLTGPIPATQLAVSDRGRQNIKLDRAMHRSDANNEPFFAVAIRPVQTTDRIVAIHFSISPGAGGAFEVDNIARPRASVEWNSIDRCLEFVPPVETWTSLARAVLDQRLAGVPLAQVGGVSSLRRPSNDTSIDVPGGEVTVRSDGLVRFNPAPVSTGRLIVVRFESDESPYAQSGREVWAVVPHSDGVTGTGS